VGLCKEIRAELRADIKSVDHKVMSVDHKVMSVDHKIESLNHKMDSKFEEVFAVAHRTQTLMEEQRSENRIVLDGIKALSERQDRVEERLDGFQRTLHVLVKANETNQ
jgi:hypothetical protein